MLAPEPTAFASRRRRRRCANLQLSSAAPAKLAFCEWKRKGRTFEVSNLLENQNRAHLNRPQNIEPLKSSEAFPLGTTRAVAAKQIKFKGAISFRIPTFERLYLKVCLLAARASVITTCWAKEISYVTIQKIGRNFAIMSRAALFHSKKIINEWDWKQRQQEFLLTINNYARSFPPRTLSCTFICQ